MMLGEQVDLAWDESTKVITACVTAPLMPFTYSLATRVAFGFITSAALKLLTGRAREVKPVAWAIAALLLFKVVETGATH